MRDRRRLWKPLALAVIVSIHGCSSSDETEPAGATLAGEEEYDLSISGSVGDGPAASAMIRVISKTGEVLETGIGDVTAGYTIDLKTKGKHYPLTIEASGGVDLISGSPLDFLLTSTVSAPRNKAIAHINPYTTLALATATQTTVGLSSQTVSAAMATVVAEFNLGMTSAVSLDPLTAPIDDSNLAEIIKSAEGLAEIFRRVAAAATRAGFSATIDTVIDAIGADLVDGTLDGSGAAGTNRQISAITVLVEAQVAAELIRNELRVNGQVATATLDDTIRLLASGQAPELTESRPVNAHLVRSVLDGIDAASALGIAGSLEAMRDDFADLQSGTTAEMARLAVPSTTTSAFSGPVKQVATGSESEFSLVLATTADEPPDTNSPPTISGTPSTSVVAGFAYAFTPTASDADGDTLSFSIVNRPAWATFSTQTGSLNGTPLSGDVGTYANIQISVSDGQASTSLPTFSIDVEATAPPPPPPPPPPPNSAPTISGVPATSVVQDAAYGFTPTASDADGDTLTFSIQNQPSWASFSSSTGQLSGVPGAGDVGTYANISISVSDGQDSVSLPAFSITVDAVAFGTATLSWDAPTTNIDGSPLDDLAGYEIAWGGTSGSYPNSVTVMNPGITSYVVENLGDGTHFFAVKAINSGGLKSDFSNEASKTIP